MLEAFVDKVQGRTPHMWITEEDSIANMRVIEDIYEKVCLPSSLPCMSRCVLVLMNPH